jgi:hypothetical protein
MKFRQEEVSPERAQKLIDNQIPNRKIKLGHVERLVNEIKADRFVLSTDPIVLDQEGRLGDGQHRLIALIQCNETLPFWVCRLEGEEDILTIRVQRSASIAPTAPDLLAFERPNVTHRTKRLAIMRMLYCLENDVFYNKSVSYVDQRDLMDKCGKDLDWIIDLFASVKFTRLVPSHFGAFILWVLRPGRGGQDLEDQIKKFSERYVSGANLAMNSPELTLRNYMLGKDTTDRASDMGRFASLFLDSLRGRSRERALASRTAMDRLGEMLKKDTPGWIAGRAL